MCAIYQPSRLDQVASLGMVQPSFDFVSEAYPSSMCPIIVADHDAMVWRQAMFGLVAGWAKDTKISRNTYNARIESITEKASYKYAWHKRQFALVPMASFKEPNYESGKSEWWRIEREDQEPFTAAAIYDFWTDKQTNEILRSFSMITINANESPLMRRFHDPKEEKRSIVIVPAHLRKDWLHANEYTIPMFLENFNSAEYTACAAPPTPRSPPQIQLI